MPTKLLSLVIRRALTKRETIPGLTPKLWKVKAIAFACGGISKLSWARWNQKQYGAPTGGDQRRHVLGRGNSTRQSTAIRRSRVWSEWRGQRGRRRRKTTKTSITGVCVADAFLSLISAQRSSSQRRLPWLPYPVFRHSLSHTCFIECIALTVILFGLSLLLCILPWNESALKESPLSILALKSPVLTKKPAWCRPWANICGMSRR